MLHKLRSALGPRPEEKLTGLVEVDESYIGGKEPGLSEAAEDSSARPWWQEPSSIENTRPGALPLRHCRAARPPQGYTPKLKLP